MNNAMLSFEEVSRIKRDITAERALIDLPVPKPIDPPRVPAKQATKKQAAKKG